jgi:tetratricopeptide (TPR) repeat protein
VLHRQVARALEVHYLDDLTPHYSALGFHCLQAWDWEKAVTYLRQAGAGAAERAAHRDAVKAFEQALPALEHLPESRENLALALQLQFDLRSSLFLLGEHERILVHLRRAEALAQKLQDKRGLARLLALMASHLWREGDHPSALEVGRRACAIASELQDLPLRILATFHLAQTRYALGDYRGAVEDLSTNVAMLTGELAGAHLGLPGPMSIVCRTYLAWALAELGAFEEAHRRCREAVRMAIELDRPAGLIDAQLGLGVVHLLRGDLEQAESALQRGLAIPGLEDHVILVQASRACLAYVQALSGRPDEAIPSLEGVVAQASVMRTVGPPRIITYLGEAYLLGGRPIDAARQAARALALARDRGERGNEAWALRLAGEVALRENLGDGARARDHFRRALELTGPLGMRPLEAHCRAGLGAVTGDRVELAAAGDLYRRLDMPFWLGRFE